MRDLGVLIVVAFIAFVLLSVFTDAIPSPYSDPPRRIVYTVLDDLDLLGGAAAPEYFYLLPHK